MKETVGSIGVGTMGKPMAFNLIKAGYPSVANDINPKPVEDLREKGVAVAPSSKEVASRSEIIITMPPKSEHVDVTSRQRYTISQYCQRDEHEAQVGVCGG